MTFQPHSINPWPTIASSQCRPCTRQKCPIVARNRALSSTTIPPRPNRHPGRQWTRSRWCDRRRPRPGRRRPKLKIWSMCPSLASRPKSGAMGSQLIQPIRRLTRNVRKIYAICNTLTHTLLTLINLNTSFNLSNYYYEQQQLHYVPYNLIII